MTEKRFTTNGYYIYDHFKEDKWLVNEVEAQLIVDKMNNLDIKARENSKALSTLQKKLDALHEENTKVKSLIDEKINYLQKKYDFGQNVYHGCPMHNIMHSINVLKEIKKEMGWE